MYPRRHDQFIPISSNVCRIQNNLQMGYLPMARCILSFPKPTTHLNYHNPFFYVWCMPALIELPKFLFFSAFNNFSWQNHVVYHDIMNFYDTSPSNPERYNTVLRFCSLSWQSTHFKSTQFHHWYFKELVPHRRRPTFIYFSLDFCSMVNQA